MSCASDPVRCRACPVERSVPLDGEQALARRLRGWHGSPCAFSAWAYIFGPLFYLARGLWRKGIMLCALWLICFVATFFFGFAFPTFADGEKQVYQALLDVYSGEELVFAGLAFLFPLAVGKGSAPGALCLALLYAGMLLVGERLLPHLDFGEFTAWIWFAAVPVWTAISSSFFLCALTRRYIACLGFAFLSVILFLTVLPVPGFFWLGLPRWLLAVYCGVAAPRDLCRRRLSRELFWW